MKAILIIQKEGIKLNLNNATYHVFNVIAEKPNTNWNNIIEKCTVGDPIKLITSDMPNDLENEIIKMIEQYCNH